MPIHISNKQGVRTLYTKEFISNHSKNELLFLLHKIISSYGRRGSRSHTQKEEEKLNSIGIGFAEVGSDTWPYYRLGEFDTPIFKLKANLSCSRITADMLCRWLFSSPWPTSSDYSYHPDFSEMVNNQEVLKDLKNNPSVRFLFAAICENLEKFYQVIQYYFQVGQESPELQPLAQRAIEDILEYENSKGEIEENVRVARVKAAEYFLEGYKSDISEGNIKAMLDHRKAVEVLQKDIQREKPFARSYFLLGKCYQKGWGIERDLLKAKENFATAKEVFIDAAVAYAMIDYEENNGNPEVLASAAAKELYEAYKVHTNNEDSYKILLKLEELAKSHENDKEVQRYLSKSYLLANQFEKALNLVSKFVNSSQELTSYTVKINRLWVDYLLEKKQFEEALKHVNAAGDSQEAIENYIAKVYFEWGSHLKESKKFSEAIEKYEKAIELKYFGAIAALGENYYLKGIDSLKHSIYEEAKLYFTKAIECGNLFAYLSLAELYFKGSISGGKSLGDYWINTAAKLVKSPSDEESFLSAITGIHADEYFKSVLQIDKKCPDVFSSYISLLKKVTNINKKLIEWRNQITKKELAGDCPAAKRAEYIWQINSILIEKVDFKNTDETKELSGNTLYQVGVDKRTLKDNAVFTSLQKNYAEFQAALTAVHAPLEADDKNVMGRFFTHPITLTNLAKAGNLLASSLLIDAKLIDTKNLTFSPAINLLKGMDVEKWQFYTARNLSGCKFSTRLKGNFISAVWDFEIKNNDQLEISPFSLALYLLKSPDAIIKNENLIIDSILQKTDEFFASLEFWLSKDSGITLAHEGLFKNLEALAKSLPKIAMNVSYQKLVQQYCPVVEIAAPTGQLQNTYTNLASNEFSPKAPGNDEGIEKKTKSAQHPDTVYEDFADSSLGAVQGQILKNNLYEEFTRIKKENAELKEQNIDKDNKLQNLESAKRESEIQKEFLQVENSRLKEEAEQLKSRITTLESLQQQPIQLQPVSNSPISAENLLAQMQVLFAQQQNTFQQQIEALQQQVQSLTQIIQSLTDNDSAQDRMRPSL